MTRKDFELIAAVLKAHRNDNRLIDISISCLARDFAEALKATNKQFNADKFIRACGVSS